MIGVRDGGGVKAEGVKGRRPVGRENSAGFRREDAGGWAGKSAERESDERWSLEWGTWDAVNGWKEC